MTEYEIEVSRKDPSSENLRKELEDLGVGGEKIDRATRYVLKGDLSPEDCERLASDLFSSNVTDKFVIGAEETLLPEADGTIRREVAFKPGVMNPAAMNIERALRSLGYDGVSAQTTQVWRFHGYNEEDVNRVLFGYGIVNKIVEQFRKPGTSLFPEPSVYVPKREDVKILGLGIDELMDVSNRGELGLNRIEMEAVQNYFTHAGRNPTAEELESIDSAWSEHCVHKTVRGKVILDYDGREIVFENLLDETIVRATRELNKPWALSVFEDNAGIIKFDEEYGIAFKVETHNHPSAVEPYGGAGTGIGGVIRDILGVGLGAKPTLNVDAFYVGMIDMLLKDLPTGVLHPRAILKRIHEGVRDYGNRMGIPTAAGGIIEDEGYTGNPLVYVGTVGIIPKKYIDKKVSPGDRAVVIGGRTGMDGIHGVTFASKELTTDSHEVSSSAVQIGNAIEEKRMGDALLKARDMGILSYVQDCGGGGLCSAFGEMGEDVGVRIDLEKPPLKYPGLKPKEVWISEAQERMGLAVSPGNIGKFMNLMRELDVEATDIGEFTGDKRLRLRYGDMEVADIDMGFLHKGVPKVEKRAVWRPPNFQEPKIEEHGNYNKTLLEMFKRATLSNKRPFIEQYDRSVQGCRVRDTLAGPFQDGPQDGVVYVAFPGSTRGYAVAVGTNPWYGEIDPKEMAHNAIDEALRNLVATGCDLEQVALLDNISAGNPNDPEVLGAICLAYMGCHDAAIGYGAPFISGKDSLNNDFEGKRVPHSLFISSLGIIPDVTKTITMDLKESRNSIYVVGMTFPELGGSEFYRMHGEMGLSVPKVNDFKVRKEMMQRLAREIYSGDVVSCHDCSEGGIVAAAAEMAMAGRKGMDISLASIHSKNIGTSYQAAFSESATRFIAEVPTGRERSFEGGMEGYPVSRIGHVSAQPVFVVYGNDKERMIHLGIGSLLEAASSRYAWRK